MKIRVLIADDHAVLRAGVRMLINVQPDMEVVAEAADGAEAIIKIQEIGPDVVLMDLAMSGQIDIPAISRASQACLSTRVLVLTMYAEPGYVRAAIAAGAAGYVVKSAADTELLTAIRAVAQGHTCVKLSTTGDTPREVLASAKGSRTGGPDTLLGCLSTRELEVFSLVAKGYTNRQVADQLGVSVKSVEAYRSRLMTKLGLRSRADLVRYAVDSGLLTPGKGAR